MSELQEVFDFLDSDREDVQKMAVQGLAQHSKDNAELLELLVKNKDYAAKVVELVSPKKVTILGDALTTLINISGDAQVVEVLIASGIVEKLMRLLDNLGQLKSIQPQAIASLRELVLILLNNLTATHICAVHDFLQVEDDDLKGFHLSRMKIHYEQLQETSERNLSKWFLQICVNITRSKEGQLIVVADDEWMPTLLEVMCNGEPPLRLLCANVFRNLSIEQDVHDELIEMSLIKICLQQVCDLKETIEEIQLQISEVLAFMLQTEKGMQVMESLNAKKLITSKAEDLPEKVNKFFDTQVIPFLEDITDAYVVQGSTQDALD